MAVYEIVLTVVYSALLLCYFKTATGDNFKYRATNKIVMASMFFVFAVVEFCVYGVSATPLYFVLLLGMAFCLSGDVVLLWSFTKGGILFCIGNILCSVFLCIRAVQLGLVFASFWWALLLYLVFVAVQAYLAYAKIIDYGGKPLIFLYLLSTASAMFISLALCVASFSIETLLVCLAFALYLLSDCCLMLKTFKYKKSNALQWVVSGTYFVGMWLLALSFSFVVV